MNISKIFLKREKPYLIKDLVKIYLNMVTDLKIKTNNFGRAKQRGK